ncbi:MAG: energy transducer TonB [Bacteroidales bacterium]|jgi:TonB family protein|nr:energy transducer TonB [Bacteroidales bacterium]
MPKRKEQKIGLYVTIIFHLVVIIILTLASIRQVARNRNSFLFDFSGFEEQARAEKEEELREKASREIKAMLSSEQAGVLKNIAVDRNARKPLKDDRYKNPDRIYDEAAALRKKLSDSRKEALEENSSVVGTPEHRTRKNNEGSYKGPSVMSYSLAGRSAMWLPVPVYKCEGGGDVHVRITVNRRGFVTDAKILQSSAPEGACINRSAIEAALRSRFSASSVAPEKEYGEIVYRFIAQ